MYDPEDVQQLAERSRLKLDYIKRDEEFIDSKLDEKVNRKFATAVITRQLHLRIIHNFNFKAAD